MICSSSSKRGHDAVMSKLFIKALFVVLGLLTLSEVIRASLSYTSSTGFQSSVFQALSGFFSLTESDDWDAEMLKPWLRPQVKEQRSHSRFSIGFYTGWLLFIHCWPSETLRQFHRARTVHLLFTAYSFARVEVKLCTWGFSLCVSGECSAELWYCVVDVRLNSRVTNLPQSFNSLCLWSFI